MHVYNYIYTSVYLYTYIPIYLYTYISIYRYIYISIYLYIYISIYLYICISVYLYICISVYIYMVPYMGGYYIYAYVTCRWFAGALEHAGRLAFARQSREPCTTLKRWLRRFYSRSQKATTEYPRLSKSLSKVACTG